MMRSLFSGVSGLKIHQTKMDVLGNNIANVNTIGFKSSSVRFSDILYQTTQAATGPNANTGAGGQNAKQIGLGSTVASITANITSAGASQRTDQALDMKITGDAFFIVNSGGANYFTKSGAFQIDGAGNLVTATGANVMGWQPDKGDPTKISVDTVSPIKIMTPENLYARPELTTSTYVTGNIDSADTDLAGDGEQIQMSFYDNLGASYTAKFRVTNGANVGDYKALLTDIIDSNNQSIFGAYDADGKLTGLKSPLPTIALGNPAAAIVPTLVDGKINFAPATAMDLKFNPGTGEFASVGSNAAEKGSIYLKIGTDTANTNFLPTGVISANYSGINMDFSSLTMFETGGSSSLQAYKGDVDGYNAGKKVGDMIGFTVGSDGKVYGKYSNGDTKLLGQIAVASFANPSGLEAVGNSMYTTTQNSGYFDGVGQDPRDGGGGIDTGILEMSNVDLSTEFTEMITTQRGFQANSKIITTSDTLLDELINLKR